MGIKALLKKTYLFGSVLILSLSSFAQNCDTTLVNAHLNPAGYKRLYVPTQPCSMYYYSTAAMYGIDAHRQAANLGVPQLVINNAQENSDVSAALYAQGVYNIVPEVWLGMTDSVATFNWKTFDGLPVTYFNWTPGEPNNLAPACKVGTFCTFCFGADAYWCANGEDCAVMNASGEWLDNTCEGSGVTRVCVLEVNTCPELSKPIDTTICAGASVSVTARDSGGTAPYTYTWNPGAQTGQTITISPSGTATYTVEASDNFHCLTDSTFTITINPNTPTANAGPDIQFCPGATDTLGAATVSGYSYSWSPALGLSSASISNPTISFASNPRTGTLDTFYVLTASSGGCVSRDTVNVTLYPNINNNFTTSTSGVCVNDDVIVTYSGTASGTATYNWNFGSATIVSGSGPGSYVVKWLAPGVDTITLSVADHGCSDTIVSKTVKVFQRQFPLITINGRDTLSTTAFPAYQWLLNGLPISGANTNVYIASVNGNYQVVTTDSSGCSDTSKIHTVVGVGIAAINGQNLIRIYPSPNNGSFIVETTNALGGEITVSDILGRVIMKQTITMDKQPVILSSANGDIAAGEYYVTVQIEGSHYTGKMIISKE